MPLTPLHFGLLAPINHFAPGKISNTSFILTNLWIDAPSIVYALFGLGSIYHGAGTHSFLSVLIFGMIIGLFGFRSRSWMYGAILGGISHVLLDMVVHADMEPFYPLTGNPGYLGWMDVVSLALIPFCVWLIAQYVSGILGWGRRKWAGSAAQTDDPTF